MAVQEDKPHAELEEAVRDALREERLKHLEVTVESLVKDRDQAFRWGVLVLGSAVIGLVVWIFNLISAVR